jgi:hypothetical protein
MLMLERNLDADQSKKAATSFLKDGMSAASSMVLARLKMPLGSGASNFTSGRAVMSTKYGNVATRKLQNKGSAPRGIVGQHIKSDLSPLATLAVSHSG